MSGIIWNASNRSNEVEYLRTLFGDISDADLYKEFLALKGMRQHIHTNN